MRQEEPMDLWVYEREAFDAGIKLVCGVDEAGRGPLAGPVCAAAVILPHLTEAEHDVYRRGRNSHVNTVPHGSTPGQYHAATAVEAVFGWLWLRGEHERARELFGYITEDYDAA